MWMAMAMCSSYLSMTLFFGPKARRVVIEQNGQQDEQTYTNRYTKTLLQHEGQTNLKQHHPHPLHAWNRRAPCPHVNPLLVGVITLDGEINVCLARLVCEDCDECKLILDAEFARCASDGCNSISSPLRDGVCDQNFLRLQGFIEGRCEGIDGTGQGCRA